MPELPDIVVYCEAVERRTAGRVLEAVRLLNPFVLRSVEPPPTAAVGRRVIGVERLGKRVVLAFEGDLFFVVHLMIAGRLHWHPAATKGTGRRGLLALDFDVGSLSMTEAGTRKRASLCVVAGRTNLTAMDPGGIEIAAHAFDSFRQALVRENHTLKRALTDPKLFSGIGNAYSDEILHDARLSPVRLTRALEEDEIRRLHASCVQVLDAWTRRLRAESVEADRFPERVTAFRPGMAVHGRYDQPCPLCGDPVQRIVYSQNECNYCARCQTGGKLLADRALSRLLKKDWPRTLEELEERRERTRGGAD